MIKKNKYILLISCGFVMLSFQLYASNLAFMKSAVIADFSDEEIQQLSNDYKRILDENKPGYVHKWHSEESKNGGEITVIKQYRQNKNNCKRLMFKNYSATQSATSYFNFCFLKKQWTLVN